MSSLSKEIVFEGLRFSITDAILHPKKREEAIEKIMKVAHIARARGATDEELREIGKKGRGVAEFIASMENPLPGRV